MGLFRKIIEVFNSTLSGDNDMTSTKSLWDRWCRVHDVAKQSVPLFDSDEVDRVRTTIIGTTNRRSILCRHREMEQLLIDQTSLLVDDWASGGRNYDGIIYMMLVVEHDRTITPLYIGKAEKLGKGDGNLSANVQRIDRDRSKFARWGDNYQYHIGDLSAASVHGHPPDKISPKYVRWAETLFEDTPVANPRLRRPVRFWAKAWKSSDIGIWSEMNPTKLTFLEYLLIGVASSIFGEQLLNSEGRNRS